MNINSNLPPYTHNPTLAKAPAQEHRRFSIETAEVAQNKADTVSISSTGAEMADAMDSSVPVGSVPSWLAEFTVEIIFLPDGRSAFKNEAKFSNLSSGEADEYFSLLQSHMDALYERNGLIDDESTYAALSSRSTNERLHQEFLEGIRNDPRMAELTGRLGIALT